jgi:hypothetical protein
MSNLPDNPTTPRRRYSWPWFVLVALVVAILLAVAWLSFEIARTRRIRDLNAPHAATPGTVDCGATAPLMRDVTIPCRSVVRTLGSFPRAF